MQLGPDDKSEEYETNDPFITTKEMRVAIRERYCPACQSSPGVPCVGLAEGVCHLGRMNDGREKI